MGLSTGILDARSGQLRDARADRDPSASAATRLHDRTRSDRSEHIATKQSKPATLVRSSGLMQLVYISIFM
jgi:hypothetical protein